MIPRTTIAEVQAPGSASARKQTCAPGAGDEIDQGDIADVPAMGANPSMGKGPPAPPPAIKVAQSSGGEPLEESTNSAPQQWWTRREVWWPILIVSVLVMRLRRGETVVDLLWKIGGWVVALSVLCVLGACLIRLDQRYPSLKRVLVIVVAAATVGLVIWLCSSVK